jgi:hypothetical protein
MTVECINDSNRPNEIPTSRWIKKGNKYTIIQVAYMTQQNIYGCKLEEINNDDLYPYSYFALTRFAVTQDEVEEAVEKNELEFEEI